MSNHGSRYKDSNVDRVIGFIRFCYIYVCAGLNNEYCEYSDVKDGIDPVRFTSVNTDRPVQPLL